MNNFKAMLIVKDDAGYRAEPATLSDDRLPDEPVTVDVSWSTLNYKDALALTGSSPIVRQFPLVPGIDFAGTVSASTALQFKPGDAVLLNGWGVGESYWGGFSQRARARAEWLLPIPAPFDARDAMAIGTAGYTAALCVLGLTQRGVTPGDGEILVTGASGGVGSMATVLLARLGYHVVAATGKSAQHDWLKSLGATEVIDRSLLSAPGKPLAKERWAGVVDSVGSHTLANACAATRRNGVVTACGLAQGMDFPASVAPFILRGVSLIGIDSVYCEKPRRLEAWNLLARHVEPATLRSLTTEIGLSELPDAAKALLAGQIRGRIVVDVNR